MATFAIIGAGMMGSAMCWPLVDNQHEVRLVGTPLDDEIIQSIRKTGIHPKLERTVPAGIKTFFHNEFADAIQGVDGILGGISSFGVDWFAEQVATWVDPVIPILSVTKGLEDESNGNLITLPVALDRRMPVHKAGKMRFNAIGGPCIAHELGARRQTSVVFTGNDLETLQTFKENLGTSYYHIWCSTDVTGVETSAALKNAYAMGVGLAVGMMEQTGPDGLANLYNPQAALFGQSCYEIGKLLRVLGGHPDNVAWLPGAGDLFVTVFGGRTVRLGKMLGQGIPFSKAREILAGVTLESVEIIKRVFRALPQLAERGDLSLDDFPLMLHLGEIICNDAVVDIPWESFFHRYYA